jgi:predicted Zn finger-like uncharacterized protein
MRIACPNCAAEYEVPEAALAAGPRLLRCARCGHTFEAAAPPPPEPAPAPAPKPEPEAEPEAPPEPPRPHGASALRPDRAPPPVPPAAPPPAESPPRERLVEPPPAPPRGPLMLAWALSLAVLAAIGWALWRYREAVIEAFPPAARLYALFGP